jgi:histidinol-phosphatase (PHP family)
VALASFHGGHSRFGDGIEGPVAIARSAKKRGFVAFGFTEHFDMPPERKCGNWLADRDPSWLGEYVNEVRKAQKACEGSMDVLLGAELDFIRGARESTRDAVSNAPFDYFVGSVHHIRVGDRDICIECDREHMEDALRLTGSVEAMQLVYYDHVTEMLEWDYVSIVAHLDVFKKCLLEKEREPTERIRARVREVLASIRDAGAALDVNTGGVRTLGEPYPARWIMEEARELDVPLTLGDDSHGPDDVGGGFGEAIEMLRSIGFKTMQLVRGHRQFEPVAIG